MPVQDTLITDPTLRQCLELASKTRQLCQEILSSLQAQAGAGELPESALIDRSKQQKLLNAYLTQLKVLHRAAFMSAREAKQTTTEARQEVDRLHLQLQNLFYEQRHLRGEIAACKDFPSVPPLCKQCCSCLLHHDCRHKYTSLPLISEEEFLALHPDHSNDSPHDLMIARLNNEKAVREDLERQRKELLAKKQSLIAENKKRKDDLASLDEQLKKFIESSRSIQTTFQKEY
ncbi:Fms-interacting protein-domain-containing protein [Kalaharituber pfeilii]|nr:Fms-interacting protein-domain-containing protein [Kalaharituber pfeilii]